jgi:hypothetical protein
MCVCMLLGILYHSIIYNIYCRNLILHNSFCNILIFDIALNVRFSLKVLLLSYDKLLMKLQSAVKIHE